jgi:hypothetical protein
MGHSRWDTVDATVIIKIITGKYMPRPLNFVLDTGTKLMADGDKWVIKIGLQLLLFHQFTLSRLQRGLS